MNWRKQGQIFCPDKTFDWMQTHASIPVPDQISPDVLRIYFGTRDGLGRSQIGFVDVDADDPKRILDVSSAPVLPLGRPGTFDDNGIMPSWIVTRNGQRFLYYIGWNPQVTVSYRLSIGLAIRNETQPHFVKHSEGPVSDRSLDEPFFNTAPCVLYENGVWRMWYVSCTGWEFIENRSEPRYHVKYADSADGITWRKSGVTCIDYSENSAAIGRPCVVRSGQLYEMFFSFRGMRGYRTDVKQSYSLGYAVSDDGLTWIRKDDDVGIGRSDSGWDSEMIEYCSIYERNGMQFMFYNGNGFGRTGFGYAVRETGEVMRR